MATFSYSGYDDDQIVWPGGTPTAGDTIRFTQPTDHTIEITDNDATLVDGTDDRDDEDTDQTAVVYDEFGAIEASGQVQPRDEIALTDGTNTYYMTEVFIAATNSSYYIFQNPPPDLNVDYTVSSVTSPNSTSYSEFSTAGVTCFTSGARIATPEGIRPVEALRPGDMVWTLDRGAQPILWIGTRRVAFGEMRRNKGLRPFVVKTGSFGAGCPDTDLIISRQHRILLTNRLVDHPKIGAEGALAPVHTLTALPGVDEVCPLGGSLSFTS